jgi:hypothetical protein
MNNRLVLAAIALFASGCVEPLHLSYDYGRAYSAAFTVQADLTRPSVANQEYVLYGIEGTKIRLLVQTATTEEKSGETTLSNSSK